MRCQNSFENSVPQAADVIFCEGFFGDERRTGFRAVPHAGQGSVSWDTVDICRSQGRTTQSCVINIHCPKQPERKAFLGTGKFTYATRMLYVMLYWNRRTSAFQQLGYSQHLKTSDRSLLWDLWLKRTSWPRNRQNETEAEISWGVSEVLVMPHQGDIYILSYIHTSFVNSFARFLAPNERCSGIYGSGSHCGSAGIP